METFLITKVSMANLPGSLATASECIAKGYIAVCQCKGGGLD
jgi:hypothetical protein